jgi:hypothetical protein
LGCSQSHQGGRGPDQAVACGIARRLLRRRRRDQASGGLPRLRCIDNRPRGTALPNKPVDKARSGRQLVANDLRNSFELFRRRIVNPEMLTFDKLLQRARSIVEHTSPQGFPQETREVVVDFFPL